MPAMRSLISLPEIGAADVAWIVARALKLADDPEPPRTLAGRAVGTYFRRSSTRTRTSFWRAATLLGADVVAFGPDDLQLCTGESLADTTRVLAGYLDILVVRTNDDIAELRELDRGGLAIVNALTRNEHPTQALADLVTLQEQLGDLTDRHVLYVGEGNSTAQALAHATAMTPGLRLTLVTPPGYGLPDDLFELTARLGAEPGRIVQHHDIQALPGHVDAVYTSRWQTMGVSKADPNWQATFEPYQVTEKLLDRFGNTELIFLHDLPAIRGQEVTDEVLDGPRSRAFRQAYHKMTAAMAVLEWCADH
jgi:ornithine carbamoyltransferase